MGLMEQTEVVQPVVAVAIVQVAVVAGTEAAMHVVMEVAVVAMVPPDPVVVEV